MRILEPLQSRVFGVALIAGLFVAGGFCGMAARLWIGGRNAQHAQLERCVLASKHLHPNRDARATLARLDVEVPACMNGAGYEQALDNDGCESAMWQGNVFCYVPKSSVGRLIYRIESRSARNRSGDDRRTGLSQREGQ